MELIVYVRPADFQQEKREAQSGGRFVHGSNTREIEARVEKSPEDGFVFAAAVSLDEIMELTPGGHVTIGVEEYY